MEFNQLLLITYLCPVLIVLHTTAEFLWAMSVTHPLLDGPNRIPLFLEKYIVTVTLVQAQLSFSVWTPSTKLYIVSRLAESGPYCCSRMFVCLYVCMSVGHSATYSLPRLIDHNQIWYAGTCLSSQVCKPFWIPYPPYSRFQMEKYGKFRLFPTLHGYHFDIRTQIKKSRRESTRMSMDSVVPKY